VTPTMIATEADMSLRKSMDCEGKPLAVNYM
jgi:hypothetical protein